MNDMAANADVSQENREAFPGQDPDTHHFCPS